MSGRMEKKNIAWINYLKAISIISVYTVHCSLYYGQGIGVCGHLLHPFYVNTFFFVSGYLLLRKQLSEPLIKQSAGEYLCNGGNDLLSNILFRIAIPSVLFSFIEFLPAIAIRGEKFSMAEMLYKTIGGGTYWFTSALVVAQLLFFLLLLTRKRNVWFYSAIGIGIGLMATYLITHDLWIGGRNYWAYKQGLISTMFLAMGGLYWRYERQINKVLRWYVIMPLLAVYIYIVGWHYGSVGCVISTFRLNGLGLLMSTIIVFLLPRMLRDLKPIEAITYIGKHSICFYFMSGALPIVLGILVRHFMDVNAFGYILVLVFSLAIAYLATYVINRWLPWLLDLRLLKKKRIIY